LWRKRKKNAMKNVRIAFWKWAWWPDEILIKSTQMYIGRGGDSHRHWILFGLMYCDLSASHLTEDSKVNGRDNHFPILSLEYLLLSLTLIHFSRGFENPFM
jgi:hypothetical protein